MEQTLTFHPDWFAIDRKNKLPQKLIVKEFSKFSQFQVDSTFRNSFFSVVNHPLMGLGIRNKNRIKVDDFGDEINGYLEFIDNMDLFHALHQLGYNSLFTYVDSRREKLYCILYGPLYPFAVTTLKSLIRFTGDVIFYCTFISMLPNHRRFPPFPRLNESLSSSSTGSATELPIPSARSIT